jgi:hypothetical protein
MKYGDFEIGKDFWCAGKRWRCTDIGSRVIVAICMEPREMATSFPGEKPGDLRQEVRSISNDPKLFDGPPYAVVESVFDEYDMQGCSDREVVYAK